MTDAGLVHLKGLTKIQWVGLAETKVTDAGLEHLKRLTTLQSLYLGDSRVTKEGVKKIPEGITHLLCIPLKRLRLKPPATGTEARYDDFVRPRAPRPPSR